MKRPLTTSIASPPPSQLPAPNAEPAEASPPTTWRDLAPIVLALTTILSAMESGPKVGPAVKAYRSAMRRHGQEATAVGGHEAMGEVLRQVVEAAPDQAEREAALTEAWAGLPGWRT